MVLAPPGAARPCTAALAVLGLSACLALAALAAWSKVHALELQLDRTLQHHDQHEDRARLCAQVLASVPRAAAPAPPPAPAVHVAEAGPEMPAMPADAVAVSRPLSLIHNGTCEATRQCSRIADEGMCRWVTTVAELPLDGGHGHFQVGESQSKATAPGCVYKEGRGRLKWNADSSSTAACSKAWGCVCLGALSCTRGVDSTSKSPHASGCRSHKRCADSHHCHWLLQEAVLRSARMPRPRQAIDKRGWRTRSR